MSGALHGFPPRTDPEELKGAPTWHMVTRAALPITCLVIAIIPGFLQR